MPIYEYRCHRCGHHAEVIQKFSDPPLQGCPQCGEAEFRKLVSQTSFQLKGAGWYVTDYKNKPEKKAEPVSADKAETKAVEKSADKPTEKPAEKPDTKKEN